MLKLHSNGFARLHDVEALSVLTWDGMLGGEGEAALLQQRRPMRPASRASILPQALSA